MDFVCQFAGELVARGWRSDTPADVLRRSDSEDRRQAGFQRGNGGKNLVREPLNLGDGRICRHRCPQHHRIVRCVSEQGGNSRDTQPDWVRMSTVLGGKSSRKQRQHGLRRLGDLQTADLRRPLDNVGEGVEKSGVLAGGICWRRHRLHSF